MKEALAILTSLLATTTLADAGTITGMVRAQGKVGVEQEGGNGKYSSHEFKFAERINYETIRDFVVYVDQPVGGQPVPPAEPVRVVTTRRINQKGAAFSPQLLPVVVGTTVEWPNNDDIYHNVFSVSEAKPFDLGLYKNPEIKRITFDKPGRIEVFCSIHSAMNCTILVLENPYFAATDAQGRYMIPNVPAGAYHLKAWHKRMPSQVKEVTVSDQGEVKMDFALSITNLPRY